MQLLSTATYNISVTRAAALLIISYPCIACFFLPGGYIELQLQEARADRGAINITLNSFGGPLNEPSMRSTDRRRLYPAIGALYPEATNAFQVRPCLLCKYNSSAPCVILLSAVCGHSSISVGNVDWLNISCGFFPAPRSPCELLHPPCKPLRSFAVAPLHPCRRWATSRSLPRCSTRTRCTGGSGPCTKTRRTATRWAGVTQLRVYDSSAWGDFFSSSWSVGSGQQ